MRKNKKYRDEARVCTPYALVWDNDHYYLVAWNDHRGTYSNFRVDRMEKVEIIDEPARRADPHFDLEDYILTHVSMFSGEESDVVISTVHSGICFVAIPEFPDGGGALRGHISPRRISLISGQKIGDIGMTTAA